jgi:acetate kinase
MPTPSQSILVLNGGSSSIRFALVRANDELTRLCSGTMERIGHGDAHLAIDDVAPADSHQPIRASDQSESVQALVQWLQQRGETGSLAAVGHRVVHGMSHFDPERITPALLADLSRIEPVDPDHLPLEIGLVKAAQAALPGVPQFACFDTQFHRHLPRVAALLPIPRRFEAQGLRRYGFHGLSYTFLMQELERTAGARLGSRSPERVPITRPAWPARGS